jgi:hypothetical protein
LLQGVDGVVEREVPGEVERDRGQREHEDQDRNPVPRGKRDQVLDTEALQVQLADHVGLALPDPFVPGDHGGKQEDDGHGAQQDPAPDEQAQVGQPPETA